MDPLFESRRPVQAALLPDMAPERPVGRIVPSVLGGSNADLITAVAGLYLAGDVCDVTYGLGKWWTRWRPEHLTAHDLDTDKGDGVDFRRLPEDDDTYDATVFDPPYIAPGGLSTSTVPGFRDGFGITQRSPSTLWRLIAAGLVECARVTKPGGFVLIKCMDAVMSTDLDMGHMRVLDLGRVIGLRAHDLIVHHTGSGPGGHNIVDVRRARRHHSYLLVFKVRP